MKTQINEDISYIGQFLAGEDKGFEMLVKKYQNRVLNIVYSLIGRDRESEDIMQEVFLKVYHNLGSFRQRSQFSTWLYRIVVNTVYDFLRRRKKSSAENDLPENIASSCDPKEALLAKEREAIIQEALKRVPLQYRAALVLKDIEGLSYIEISRILGCSIGTVESKIYRARQSLKDKLLKSVGGVMI